MDIIELKNYIDLAYGQNLEQRAAISPIENGIEYKILDSSTNLEYIDYLNLSRIVEIMAEFFDVNATALAKEDKLFAVALGSSIDNAFEKATDVDPANINGCSAGFTKEVKLNIAKLITAMRIRNVVAPRFEKEAMEYLLDNNVNLIQIVSPLQELLGFNEKEVRLTPFGYLVQDINQNKLTKSTFKVAGKIKPTQQQAEDAIFAWKVAKYVNSRAAVIAKDLTTKSIVQTYTSSIEAVECAVDKACENSKDAILATDGTIENEEIINAAIQGRIGLIIDAADSTESSKLIKLCDKYNIVYIATGIRNNRY